MRVVFITLWVATFLESAYARAADTGLDIERKLFSECGIASGLLVIAVIYLATVNAKTRSAWEVNRTTMSESYEKLALSHARLEAIVMTLKTKA